MTALGFLYPGHCGEDDYPRIEQLLGSDIRVDLVHTDIGEDALGVDALRAMGSPQRLEAGTAELRLAGADAVVWACTSGGFVHGWEGAQQQVRDLARTAGLPASSTSFAFVHAAREIGARRVAIGATYPNDVAELFADFLRTAGIETVAAVGSGTVTAAEAATWTESEVLALARSADHPDAEAVLLPNTALHTAAHIPLLEKELGKPVLTANQVTVWECLRLADRRVNAPELGALFTREPVVQV
ncbi:aspartate/glutamate racemase family protein [Streptomyces sp. AC627_RSS907]|uniref:maleate cis-trans isomerase family protein n=1 Tax=Streptomyces sp. AC627_RSS907 TaxID=2823684 RepID=UPI001C21F91F|nr:aspartate/glutamate racemase family protein [Streptomyces sp. AC627_RSS907]